jgi:4'-phosphopantetheinyl transferase
VCDPGSNPNAGRLNLEPDEVHVWSLELDAPAGTASAFGQLLSPDERQRAAALASSVQARRFSTGRSALRRILSGYVGADPRSLVFGYGSFGKPRLVSEGGRHLQFSVSHTGGLGQVAVRRDRPIGIDLEVFRPVADAVSIARRFLTDAEADLVEQLPADRQAEGFLRLWTVKESYVKVTGLGLALSMQDVQVLDLAEQGWEVILLAPVPGVVGAVVTGSPLVALRRFTFA